MGGSESKATAPVAGTPTAADSSGVGVSSSAAGASATTTATATARSYATIGTLSGADTTVVVQSAQPTQQERMQAVMAAVQAPPTNRPLTDAEMQYYADRLGPFEPHRCNPRVDDVLAGVVRFPPQLKGTFRQLIRCFRAEPGKEPDDPYIFQPPLPRPPPVELPPPYPSLEQLKAYRQRKSDRRSQLWDLFVHDKAPPPAPLPVRAVSTAASATTGAATAASK